jgi:Tol biopolymer transport system component
VYAGAAESGLELYVCDPAGTAHRQLTRLGGSNGVPAWSPDGKRIAFQHVAQDEQIASLYVMNADGSGAAVVLAAAGVKEGGRPAWKPR